VPYPKLHDEEVIKFLKIPPFQTNNLQEVTRNTPQILDK